MSYMIQCANLYTHGSKRIRVIRGSNADSTSDSPKFGQSGDVDKLSTERKSLFSRIAPQYDLVMQQLQNPTFA